MAGQIICECACLHCRIYNPHFTTIRQAIGYFICISKRQLILWSKYVCTKPSFLRGWQYVGCCQRCHRSPHGTMRVPWKQQQIPVRHRTASLDKNEILRVWRKTYRFVKLECFQAQCLWPLAEWTRCSSDNNSSHPKGNNAFAPCKKAPEVQGYSSSTSQLPLPLLLWPDV